MYHLQESDWPLTYSFRPFTEVFLAEYIYFFSVISIMIFPSYIFLYIMCHQLSYLIYCLFSYHIYLKYHLILYLIYYFNHCVSSLIFQNVISLIYHYILRLSSIVTSWSKSSIINHLSSYYVKRYPLHLIFSFHKRSY